MVGSIASGSGTSVCTVFGHRSGADKNPLRSFSRRRSGETLYGGSWVRLRAHARSGEPSYGYGIHHDITDHIDVVTSLPPLARRLGTGSHWATIYASTATMLDLALTSRAPEA